VLVRTDSIKSTKAGQRWDGGGPGKDRLTWGSQVCHWGCGRGTEIKAGERGLKGTDKEDARRNGQLTLEEVF